LSHLIERVEVEAGHTQKPMKSRSLPGHLVEATQPAVERLGDRTTVSPQLTKPAGPCDDDQVHIRPLVAFPAAQRALQQQSADALVC
jgi:hypothetical protein